jgi:epsilon-lactone hydrolase
MGKVMGKTGSLARVFLFFGLMAQIRAEKFPARNVPARVIPVPEDVSIELQKNIAEPLDPLMYIQPQTMEEWKEIIAKGEGVVTKALMESASRLFPVNVEKGEMGGVKIHTVTPKTTPKKNCNRVLIYVHGGGYILNGGEGSVPEAMAMAYYGQIKVISIDYRMLPESPFPAGLEDVVAVYKEVLKEKRLKEQIVLALH